MKKIVFIFLIISHYYIIEGQNVALNWVKQMSGTGDVGGRSVALDASGNVYTTGAFSGTVDFDSGIGTYTLTSFGNNDIFVSKYDALGNFIWVKQIGGIDYDNSYSITIDASGNLYITGFFEGICDFNPGSSIYNLTSVGLTDVFVSKLDASGNFVWAKQIGGTDYDNSYSITVDVIGNIYITGNFHGTTDFDPSISTYTLTSEGYGDIFVCKLDASGNFVWAKQMGGTDLDYGTSITLDNLGNIYTTGSFEGTADFDPSINTYTFTHMGFPSQFVSKIDVNGDFIWAKEISGYITYGNSISVDVSGNVYTTGSFRGTTDFDPSSNTYTITSGNFQDVFVSKLDASGNFVWAKSMGGNDYDYGNSIKVDGSGNVFIIGEFSGTADFDPSTSVNSVTSVGGSDIFVSKLDASGNFVWIKHMEGAFGDEYGNSLTLNTSGDVYTTGAFITTVDFDPNSGVYNLSSSNGYAAFIHKMSPSTVGVIEKNSEKNIKIYPNPTNDNIQIDLGNNYGEVIVVVKNMLGQTIHTQHINSPALVEIKGERGMYFIEVKNQNGEITQFKIIKN